MALTDKLTAIADAIRTKTGKTNAMTLDEMASEISNIESSSTEVGFEYKPENTSTELGAYTFYGCEEITKIDLSQLSVTTIPFDYAGNAPNLKEVILPSTVTVINRSFENSGLEKIILPDGLAEINGHAFEGTNITEIVIPEGVKQLTDCIFRFCDKLITVTFKGTPDQIVGSKYAAPFLYCDNLTTINVPWSEGEVSGAPWGATNATVNYNYTGEVSVT